MEIKIFNLKDNLKEWSDLCAQLEPRYKDVFLMPGYASIYEKVYGANGGIFYIKRNDEIAAQAFLKRPINTLPFMASEKNVKFFDIITPEYSGPVIQSGTESKPELLEILLNEFGRFCASENIITEFGRLNPYYNNDKSLLDVMSAVLNRQVVCIDLTQDLNVIWKAFSKGNKSSIRKSRKEGVSVEKGNTESDLKEFYRLYSQTMQRNQAGQFYYFSLDFFQDIFKNLADNASLFLAYFEGKIVAASIFLHCGNYFHYYFSGSDSEYFRLCPNNLLLFETIKRAKEEGFKIFNLGGGYHNSGSDSLFAFKSSFSGKFADFNVYKRIHSQAVYKELCDKFMAFSGKLNEPVPADNAYFPLYRG